jgi:hypothetical protein
MESGGFKNVKTLRKFSYYDNDSRKQELYVPYEVNEMGANNRSDFEQPHLLSSKGNSPNSTTSNDQTACTTNQRWDFISTTYLSTSFCLVKDTISVKYYIWA